MTLKYTPDHEWLLLQADGSAIVGITHHAQDALGDVVFVEPPKPGAKLSAKAVAGVVESVKAAADVYMPINGEILSVNTELQDEPGLINTDPLGRGWLFTIRPDNAKDLDALLDSTGYESLLKQG